MSDKNEVIPNLISKLDITENKHAPIKILRQQALNLDLEANDSIKSSIIIKRSSDANTAYFNYQFYISTKSSDFRYQLFNISHEKSTYPMDLYLDSEFPIEIGNQDELYKNLKLIFESPQTKDLIQNLISIEEVTGDSDVNKLDIDTEFPPEEDLPF